MESFHLSAISLPPEFEGGSEMVHFSPVQCWGFGVKRDLAKHFLVRFWCSFGARERILVTKR
jgi:hypothetical protein